MPWLNVQRRVGTAHREKRSGAVLSVLMVLLAISSARADDGPLTKALKRVPAQRQGPVIDMIGKRGTAADLTFLFEQTLKPEGFPRASRLKALDALAEAAQTRESKPAGDLSRLAALMELKSDPAA